MQGPLEANILTPQAMEGKTEPPRSKPERQSHCWGQQGPNMLRRLAIGTLLASRVPIQVDVKHDSEGALRGIWGSTWLLANWFFGAGGAHLPAQT